MGVSEGTGRIDGEGRGVRFLQIVIDPAGKMDKVLDMAGNNAESDGELYFDKICFWA